MKISEMLEEFHAAFGHPRASFPNITQTSDVRELRMDLLNEEFEEYLQAEHDNDLIGIADALGDMLYIIYGTALVYGIPLDNVVQEIHRSNMTKLGLDGKPVYADNGKVVKGPVYERPDIAGVIAKCRFHYLIESDETAGLNCITWTEEDGKTLCGICNKDVESTALVFAKTHAKKLKISEIPNDNKIIFSILF